jgi:hypothetical protein
MEKDLNISSPPGLFEKRQNLLAMIDNNILQYSYSIS